MREIKSGNYWANEPHCWRKKVNSFRGEKINKKETKQEDYQMKRGNQGAKKEKSKTKI